MPHWDHSTTHKQKIQQGITCHLYRKHELVKLCELAQELDLEKITSTNDYELSQVNRRTITENGVTQAVSSFQSHFFLINSMSHCSILGNSFKSDGHIGTCPISHTACVTPKKTTEMLYLLPTLPSIRFTPRTTAPVLRMLNGPFHFYRE
jgi:hypothetical protein